jgi:pentapeptide MXKDX repeat protein
MEARSSFCLRYGRRIPGFPNIVDRRDVRNGKARCLPAQPNRKEPLHMPKFTVTALSVVLAIAGTQALAQYSMPSMPREPMGAHETKKNAMGDERMTREPMDKENMRRDNMSNEMGGDKMDSDSMAKERMSTGAMSRKPMAR